MGSRLLLKGGSMLFGFIAAASAFLAAAWYREWAGWATEHDALTALVGGHRGVAESQALTIFFAAIAVLSFVISTLLARVRPRVRQKAGWYSDPKDSRRARWWDGRAWTEAISHEDLEVLRHKGAPHFVLNQK